MNSYNTLMRNIAHYSLLNSLVTTIETKSLVPDPPAASEFLITTLRQIQKYLVISQECQQIILEEIKGREGKREIKGK